MLGWAFIKYRAAAQKRVSSASLLAVTLPLLQDVRVDPRRGGRLRQADAGLPRRPACPALVPEAASIGEAGPGLFKKGLMKFDLSENCFPPSDVHCQT